MICAVRLSGGTTRRCSNGVGASGFHAQSGLNVTPTTQPNKRVCPGKRQRSAAANRSATQRYSHPATGYAKPSPHSANTTSADEASVRRATRIRTATGFAGPGPAGHWLTDRFGSCATLHRIGWMNKPAQHPSVVAREKSHRTRAQSTMIRGHTGGSAVRCPFRPGRVEVLPRNPTSDSAVKGDHRDDRKDQQTHSGTCAAAGKVMRGCDRLARG